MSCLEHYWGLLGFSYYDIPALYSACFMCDSCSSTSTVGWALRRLCVVYVALQIVVAGDLTNFAHSVSLSLCDLVAAFADAGVLGFALHGVFFVVALKVG